MLSEEIKNKLAEAEAALKIGREMRENQNGYFAASKSGDLDKKKDFFMKSKLSEKKFDESVRKYFNPDPKGLF